MVLTLPIRHWAIDTTLMRSPILQQEEFSSLISAMTIVKTLPRWDKHNRMMWDYVKKYWYFVDIMVLHFMLFVTVIQIISTAQGTSLLEQSSSFLHCHICCFISWSEVMFPSGIIVVEVWNSTYVVLIENWLFPQFFEPQYITVYAVMEKGCDIKYCVKNIQLLYNSVFAMWHFHQCFSSE